MLVYLLLVGVVFMPFLGLILGHMYPRVMAKIFLILLLIPGIPPL